MTDQIIIIFIGAIIAMLQAAIFSILKNMQDDIKGLAAKISAHNENYEIHCEAEMKKRCLAFRG